MKANPPLKLSFTLIFLLLFAVSCKKDAAKSSADALTSGTWRLTSVAEERNGVWGPDRSDDIPGITLEFLASGTVYVVRNGNDSNTGRWHRAADGRLTIDGATLNGVFNVDELTKSSLRLSFDQGLGPAALLRYNFTR